MDLFGLLLNLSLIVLVSITIYLANRAVAIGERESKLLEALLGVLILMSVFYPLTTLISSFAPDPALAQVSPAVTSSAITFVGALVIAGIASAFIQSFPLRQRFRAILPMNTRYDAGSLVHTTAVVLCLLMVSMTVEQFIAGGGISGLASDLEAGGVSVVDVLFNEVMWLLAAFLGIGLWLRRTPQAGFLRLGLRVPTLEDLTWGVSVGIGMVMVVFAFSIIWLMVVTSEEFAAQNAASAQVAQVFDTIPNALILSLLVAVGEETFFRGALRPVFGNVLTSIFFILLHSQYIFSPATIPLFLTSLAFGWLRSRQSTSASIVAHFMFNFTQLFLRIAAGV